MNKRLFCLTTLAVLSMTVMGQAATWENWSGAAGDRDWNNPANWDNNRVPNPDEWALLAKEDGPIVGVGSVVNIDRIDVGRNTIGHLIVDGGTINASNTIYICSGTTEGTLDMFSGTINIEGGSNMNWVGKSTLNMYGGNYNVQWNLNLSQGQSSTDCTVNLYGGVMDVGDLTRSSAGGAVLVNVQGGTLILAGDDVAAIQAFVDANELVAYNGQGDLSIEFDADLNKTTVTASHPFVPVPADGSLSQPGNLTLGWTLPEGVEMVDVWFSDDMDKIFNADPTALVVDQEKVSSVEVTTEYKKRYFWAVDIYTGDNNPDYGPLFSFLTDHAAPVVTVGEDYDMFLRDGQRSGTLTGSIVDDGAIEPYTVEWTVAEEPSEGAATIADPQAEETTVSVTATGRYVFKLTADDGEYTGSDDMVINVYEDTWGE